MEEELDEEDLEEEQGLVARMLHHMQVGTHLTGGRRAHVSLASL